MRQVLTSLALAVLTIGLLAAAPRAAEPLKVVATFSILGDMVTQVGGGAVEVVTLVPPGGDAHSYQPAPKDAQAIAAAGLVVVNGLRMEGWLDRLILASGTRAPVVVASSGVKPLIMGDEGGSGAKAATDPHAWQNLANGQIYVRTIAEALANANPVNADGYRRRADAYVKELADLDRWVHDQIDQVPPAKRKVITSHDAFGYFAKAYGITFLAPSGISTESEPTAAGLGKLTNQIKAEHIKALFLENMTDPRLLAMLAKDSGAVIGGTLYSDSLSPAGGPADSYVAMFRHNVPALAAAMQKN